MNFLLWIRSLQIAAAGWITASHNTRMIQQIHTFLWAKKLRNLPRFLRHFFYFSKIMFSSYGHLGKLQYYVSLTYRLFSFRILFEMHMKFQCRTQKISSPESLFSLSHSEIYLAKKNRGKRHRNLFLVERHKIRFVYDLFLSRRFRQFSWARSEWYTRIA